MTVVLINNSSIPVSSTLNVPTQPTGLVSWQQYTSSDASYWQSATLTITNGASNVTVPGYGIVTLYGTGSPGLRSSISPGPRIDLSWPGGSEGFQLQTKTSLDAQVPWIPLSNALATNGWFTASAPATNTASFFRLAK
jgi:hypothetical protein